MYSITMIGLIIRDRIKWMSSTNKPRQGKDSREIKTEETATNYLLSRDVKNASRVNYCLAKVWAIKEKTVVFYWLVYV